MKTSIITPRWASLEAASTYSGLSKSTIYRLIERGHVEASRVGTRRLVDLPTLDQHLENCRVKANPGSLPPAGINSAGSGGTEP